MSEHGLSLLMNIDSFLVIVKSVTELQKALDSHTRSLPCDYIKSHLITSEQKSSKENRILWHMKDIPCDNVPFSVESHQFLICSYGNSSRISKKRLITSEGSGVRCCAKIGIRKIKKYTDFSLPPGASKRKRLATLNKLKNLLATKQDEVNSELLYRVSFPLRQVHNHEFDGKARSINVVVADRIKDLVDSGVTSAAQVKEILEDHVRSMFVNDSMPPLLSDEAYFPSQKKIKDAIYNYRKRSYQSSVNGSPKIGMLRKRLKKISNPEEETSCPSFRPNTLEDVVQAFCVDDCDMAPDGVTCLDLRKTIDQKLNRLSRRASTIEDRNLLQQLCDSIDQILNLETYSTTVHVPVDTSIPVSFNISIPETDTYDARVPAHNNLNSTQEVVKNKLLELPVRNISYESLGPPVPVTALSYKLPLNYETL